MNGLIAYVDGIGWWTPGSPDWAHAVHVLRDGAAIDADPAARPASGVLPPNERRRAPDSVRLACEVAEQACAMAECAPSSLPCVFASTQGDCATTDVLCATLAEAPLDTSPTRFHNSVHNAPVGYWTIAAQCRAPSAAVAAAGGSFAAGLLEAAIGARADATPVLFAAYDIPAAGPLVDVVATRTAFAAALVLSPERGPHTRARLILRHEARAADPVNLPASLGEFAAGNPVATGLPLFIALAKAMPATVHLRNGPHTRLAIEVEA